MTSSPSWPQVLFVGSSHIEPYLVESPEEIDRDPRGLLLMWAPPDPSARYIMGCDPTVGRTGWTRASRTPDDTRVDNAAIEIFEIDGAREPVWATDDRGKILEPRIQSIDPVTRRPKWHYRDVQVAEFAAPCDAVEIARVINVLGRIYHGQDEECELIYESYPGPGMLTTQELLRLGYGNIWMWETFADGASEPTRAMGWHSTPRSQQVLWYRARRHLLGRNAILRSKWLLSEYANAEIDAERMRARAAYGSHDDRFQAANMCFWAGHRWTQDTERVELQVTASPMLDYQLTAPTLDNPMSYSEWKSSAMDEWD